MKKTLAEWESAARNLARLAGQVSTANSKLTRKQANQSIFDFDIACQEFCKDFSVSAEFARELGIAIYENTTEKGKQP